MFIDLVTLETYKISEWWEIEEIGLEIEKNWTGKIETEKLNSGEKWVPDKINLPTVVGVWVSP